MKAANYVGLDGKTQERHSAGELARTLAATTADFIGRMGGGAIVRPRKDRSPTSSGWCLQKKRKEKENRKERLLPPQIVVLALSATPAPAQMSPTDPRRSIPPPSDRVASGVHATQLRDAGDTPGSRSVRTWGWGGRHAVRREQSEHWKPPPPPPPTPHDPALAPASLMVGPGMWPLIGGRQAASEGKIVRRQNVFRPDKCQQYVHTSAHMHTQAHLF